MQGIEMNRLVMQINVVAQFGDVRKFDRVFLVMQLD
jgi:hypothetical protein